MTPHRHLSLLDSDELKRREWLVANGLGGYASGTLGGLPMRRYHGYLIAALPNPAGRVMMLNSLGEHLRFADGTRADLGSVVPAFTTSNAIPLVDFELELGLPVWRYHGHGVTIERRLVMAYGHNTTTLVYRLVSGDPVRLELRPAVQFRGHDDLVSTEVPDAYVLHAHGARLELTAPPPLPSLRLHLEGARTSFVIEPMTVPDLAYTIEEHRGYDSRGNLYSPGRFRAELKPGHDIALIASTESWDTVVAMTSAELVAAEHERRQRLLDAAPARARTGPAAELVLAADQSDPARRRHEDHVRARSPATRPGP